MLEVEIGYYEPPPAGIHVPEIQIERVVLPLKKLQKRVGGLLTLSPIEGITTSRTAWIRCHQSDYDLVIEFWGEEEEISCFISDARSERYLTATVVLETCKELLGAVDAGKYPWSFFEEQSIEYRIEPW